MSVATPTPRSAMVIMAHPDDIEYFVGGTVALWAAAGCAVTFVLLTSGERGSDDPSLTLEQIAAIRQTEARAAARVLGVERVVFLHEPDGEVMPTLELRRHLVAEIRRNQPDAVLIFDPSRFYLFEHNYINHPDHLAAGEAALAAISPAARNRRYHPELLALELEPHIVKEIWFALASDPDCWVDITSVLDTKIAAMRCHASQIRDIAATDEALRRFSQSITPEGHIVHREGFRRMVVA